MVTQDDSSQRSRVPSIEDLVGLCRELSSRGAKYVVIGGMAVLQHGLVRATEDIDLLVDTTITNEKAVLEAVSRLPDRAALELVPGDIEKYEVIRVADEIVVDLMKTACGIGFEEASKSIMKVNIQGVEVPFASLDLMIKLKKGVRPKDKMDFQFLTALKQK